MSRKVLAWVGLVLGLQVLSSSPALAIAKWRVELPDTVIVEGGTAYLRDVSAVPVPAAVGRLVVHAGAAPNTAVVITRQGVLRKLVTAGKSAGVSFRGAESCQVVFAGRELSTSALSGEIRQAVQALVPTPLPGAPDSWFEIELPPLRISAAGDWRVQLNHHTPLLPGRNLVPVKVVSPEQSAGFTATVVLHSFGEVAHALRKITKDTPLRDTLFSWEWQDLSHLPPGVASGRLVLEGASATRTIAAGGMVRQADLKDTPLIMAGDPVELIVVRGQVAVTVRAFARQPGCLGQTIPVRNELTGRLVNAKVAGPGLVEWRR